MVTRLLFACALLLGALGCASVAACPGNGESCVRILFLGNSYTSVNDLPGTLSKLALSGGHHLETGMATEGGATLAAHLASPGTLATLRGSRWAFVVLQEQSQLPALDGMRREQMYPAARSLVSTIAAAGARPIFFLTWAHRDGWPVYGLPDYAAMQAAIDTGYLAIARELGAPVAPVGEAWLEVYRRAPQLALWQDDGSHPSVAGTYLAACVFYAALFEQSPVGLTYVADLPKDTALSLQGTAATVVLGHPGQCGLP